ncbi:uncharacterized protein LOC131943666 [Physella acuta]|uniref:uncharacterized protein LOC131943666 n=1 Tax=Physella acuta TaxID=109671 RepID=UPI0027DB8C7C|nr:uncharacterized protein LOC131943666 [Physella acuta]
MPQVSNNTGRLMVGWIVMFVGLILHIVGQAMPYWFSNYLDESPTNFGLWQICDSFRCVRIAMDSAVLTSSYHVCRAAAVIGIILGITAMVMMFVYAFKEQPIYSLISSVIGVLSCVFIAVCVSVWATHVFDTSGDFSYYGASFYLSLFGGVLLLKGSLWVLLFSLGHYRWAYRPIESY